MSLSVVMVRRLSSQQDGTFEKAHLSVVYHRDNNNLTDTSGGYSDMIADRSLFSSLTVQEVIEAAKGMTQYTIDLLVNTVE